jgi:hypothetical protein
MTFNGQSELEFPLRSKNDEMCTRRIQLIVKSNELSSKIEPIVLTAKVNPNIPEGIMEPILSPISKIEVERELEFDRNCPPKNLCNSKERY